MLIPIQPAPELPTGHLSVPTWLKHLVDPSLNEASLPAAIDKVLAYLGFQTMLYGTARTEARGGDERFYFWTTVSPEWVAEYDQNSYVEVDPRVTCAWESPPPLIWDATLGISDERVARFLERASKFGIGSGLALYFHEAQYSVLISLNRAEPRLSLSQRTALENVIGDAMHFGYIFHWIFMRRVITRGVPPLHEGAPLSPRELQCVTYAAHGMTSGDIGIKLGIAERTVNFHFSNLMSKLGVLNRHEAIATAVAKGLVVLQSAGDAKRSRYFARRLGSQQVKRS
jgi:DNA-binding CsgD family transcriptional regulator